MRCFYSNKPMPGSNDSQRSSPSPLSAQSAHGATPTVLAHPASTNSRLPFYGFDGIIPLCRA